MGMPSGKYTRIDPDNPQAVGQCQLSGFMCRREDIVKQPVAVGDRIVWLGEWIHKDFIDEINPSSLISIPRGDPKPIAWPLPPTDDPTVGD